MSDDTMPSVPDVPGGRGIELAGGVRVAEGAVRFQFARSGGPGGQNVNKVNTKAELWVDPAGITGMTDAAKGRLLALVGNRLTVAGEIHLNAETERTQERNREAVLEKLKDLVLRRWSSPSGGEYPPTRASKRRRLEAKRRRGKSKRTGAGESEGGVAS